MYLKSRSIYNWITQTNTKKLLTHETSSEQCIRGGFHLHTHTAHLHIVHCRWRPNSLHQYYTGLLSAGDCSGWGLCWEYSLETYTRSVCFGIWTVDHYVDSGVEFSFTVDVACLSQRSTQVRPYRGSKLMTFRSWQWISCHWDACSNHLAISDYPYQLAIAGRELLKNSFRWDCLWRLLLKYD